MQEIRGKLKEVAALGASGRFAEMRSLSDDVIRGTNDIALLLVAWVVKFVRHAMRPSELINPVAFVQMLPGRCTPVQLAASACCKKFQYIP